jgi:catechol 2,3-dioxygenase-like lactoylglutathione lyase family enzyme
MDTSVLAPDTLGAPAVTERAVPILPVDDLDVARRFYVDQLGFAAGWEYRSESGTEGLLGVQRGGMKITLDCPMSGHGRDACVSLEVVNADAYYEEWASRGVPMKRKPRDEDWGARTFDVIDPFGNTIFVIGPTGTGVSA